MLKLDQPHAPRLAGRSFTVSREVLSQVQQALQGLQYGHVSLTIHDGRLIQIDRVQRSRLDRRPERD